MGNDSRQIKRGLLAALKDAIRLRAQRRKMLARALEFNREHTFVDNLARLNRPQRGLWMCPSCGSVHKSIGSSPFGGPRYPACCEFEAGSRKDRRHATGL